MIKYVWLLKVGKKKNGNKGGLIILAHTVTKTNNSLKTDKYMTAIMMNQSSEYKDAHYVGIAVI